MTKDHNNSVRLSPRDWVGMAGVVVGIIATIAGSYHSLTSSIVEMGSMQTATLERIERMEQDILRLEERIFSTHD
tara:strand:+ start:2304 stop:2528 length:225 start_codon:yes stop_codon:yes gene_type:complete